MKKVVLFAAVAVLGLASCKKEYTCECTVTSPFVNGTASETYGKMKKKDAEKKCDANDESDAASNTTVECSIK